MGRKFTDLENAIVDLRQTGQGQDGVRWPVQLAGQLGYVGGNISASAGAAPTAQQRSVYTVLDRQSRATKSALDLLIQRDLAELNAKLKAALGCIRNLAFQPLTPGAYERNDCRRIGFESRMFS